MKFLACHVHDSVKKYSISWLCSSGDSIVQCKMLVLEVTVVYEFNNTSALNSQKSTKVVLPKLYPTNIVHL